MTNSRGISNRCPSVINAICFGQGSKNGFYKNTLDTGINIAPCINVAPETFGKNNKQSPLKKLIPLHQITEFWTFLWITLFNKGTPMFIPESRVLLEFFHPT